MSDPFLGEIIMFGGNFAIRNHAFCDGQLLPIAQNTALFSLLGTTFGGDGRTTFGLPDLRGRAPMHPGNGPGLTPRSLGQKVGVETVTLNANQLPAHTHEARAAQEDATTTSPAGASLGIADESVYRASGTSVAMHAESLAQVGANAPHDNMQPYLAVNFLIATQGTYPSRS